MHACLEEECVYDQMTPRDTCVECHDQQHSAFLFPYDVCHILETTLVSLPNPTYSCKYTWKKPKL